MWPVHFDGRISLVLIKLITSTDFIYVDKIFPGKWKQPAPVCGTPEMPKNYKVPWQLKITCNNLGYLAFNKRKKLGINFSQCWSSI